MTTASFTRPLYVKAGKMVSFFGQGQQVLRRHAVARKAVPGEGLAAGQADIGHLPEVLPPGDVGQVDLHRREPHCFQRVQESHAGVGVGGGVDDDAVHFAAGALDGVHQDPLVVGLEDLAFDPQLSAEVPDILLQGGVGLPAVDIRLPDAQHIQVGAVEKQQLHRALSSFSMVSSVSSRGPPLSTVRSAKAA